MTYTALSPSGPRIALAMSEDLFHWERIGLATFEPFKALISSTWTTKTPASSRRHSQSRRENAVGPPSPSAFSRHPPEETALQGESGLWIASMKASGFPIVQCRPRHGAASSRPVQLASSAGNSGVALEKLKIGGGTPPMLTRHGWLIITTA